MLFKVSIRMAWHEWEKLLGAVSGVAFGGFLVVFQCGLYLGYIRDTTVVLDAFDADIWIIPKHQTTFDGVTHMDDLSYWQARSMEGVCDASRVIWGDAYWKLPGSGGNDYVQVLGIDLESSVDIRLSCKAGDLRSLVKPDGHILIGTGDQDKLEVSQYPEGPFEVSGRTAQVVGLIDDVHLFTTGGFVATSLDNARAYLHLPASHVTYIVCKCEPGCDAVAVAERLQQEIPEHEVLTTDQFRTLCSTYWETRSGIGPVILMSAGLAVFVGLLIVGLTFYVTTLEKLPVYGCMKAMGGVTSEIATIISIQVLLVFFVGASLAALVLFLAVPFFRHATIPILLPPWLVAASMGALLLFSLLGAALSLPRLFAVDPGDAFRT